MATGYVSISSLRNVYLGLLPFFDWVVCFFIAQLYEFFVYFGDKVFVSCIICKDFVSLYGLSFHFFMVSFDVQKLLYLIRFHLFMFVFISIALGD